MQAKLPRYFMRISFDGTGYSGWQRQINTGNCIQTIVEDTLSKILKRPVFVVGCGRTDAGVHASKFYLHFDALLEEDTTSFLQKLNYSLPGQMAAHEVISVAENANARFDAIEREYTFYLHFEKNVFLERFSSYYPINELDVDLMQQAIGLIPEAEDFVAFCKTPQRMKHTLCKVFAVGLIYHADEKRLIFKIRANRFLKSMIRIMMHELLELGQHKKTLWEFQNLLQGQRPRQISTIAYPQGLYLSDVVYPYLISNLTLT